MSASSVPVVVGVAAFSHRPADGPVPTVTELMVEAVRRAADDTGAGDLLARVGWVGVPKGAWSHPDPGRVVAEAIGARAVHTVLAEVGVLQQEVIDRACQAVVDGAVVAVVVGAEAAYGSTAGAAGSVVEARSAPSEPDEHLVTENLGVSPVEIAAGFYDPPTVYAVIESAWAASQGWTAAEHRRRLGDLWAEFARVASTNPAAWRTDSPEAATILDPSPANRLVATPYTKLCCSNLRVDQASALIITTVEVARSVGIPEDRWVFPLAAAVANHAVPVLLRPDLARSPNAVAAGERALGLAGLGIDDVAHLDLYSCFPAAVQVAAGELGIDPSSRQATVTGGMTFAGGPLNSYVLHATTAMAGVLRGDPGSAGLVTSVSGFLTKYGAAVWSTAPPASGWRRDDVTDEVAASAIARPEVTPDAAGGPVRIVGATVEHTRNGERRVVAVAETSDGVRTVVVRADEESIAAGLAGELIGTTTAAVQT